MFRTVHLPLCIALASVLLYGCGITGTITTHIYEPSSNYGNIKYFEPTKCAMPSYWFSAQVHPGVRLEVAERNLGWGPLITVQLEVDRGIEIQIDGPIEIEDATSLDRFALPGYALQMRAGPSPIFDWPAVLFGPQKEPQKIIRERIYESAGRYLYNTNFPIKTPRHRSLRLLIPAIKLGQAQSSAISIDFKDKSITWRKNCYDLR